MGKTWIAHLDLDCFFVSVERCHNPALNGQPVVVGGSATGRGVVASASYEARKFGVHSAMPTSRALNLCPGLIVVPGRHGEYSAVSERLYRRLCELAPVVELASIDEMYLDLTGCEALYDHDLPGFLGRLKELVRREFQLPCTIALAANKLVAKVAANTVKPDGLVFVPHGSEEAFLGPLPVAALPGVGKKTEEFLKRRGIDSVASLQSLSLRTLTQLLGKHGHWLFRASHGHGSTNVEPEHERKSVSREETFEKDIADINELEHELFRLTESVCSTLRREHSLGRTITLKVRYANFDTITRSSTVPPTNYDPVVFEAGRAMLRSVHEAGRKIRLLGIGLSQLVDERDQPEDLFSAPERKNDLLVAVDKLRKRFGKGSIHIGNP